MDEQRDAIEHNKMWEFFDSSEGGQSIEKNLVKNKLANKIARNSMSNKLTKEKKKSAKERNKLAKEKIKSITERKNKHTTVKTKFSMEKAKNLVIHERDKHNVRRITTRGKPRWRIKEQRWMIREAFKFMWEFCWF